MNNSDGLRLYVDQCSQERQKNLLGVLKEQRLLIRKLKSLNQLLTQEVKILLNHMMKVNLNV